MRDHSSSRLATSARSRRSTGSPGHILDLGTGTGTAALAAARRFPEAEVVGVDLSEEMLAEARRKTPPELAGRVRFEQADGARLPYPAEAFELVTLANMIPFFDELARVTAPRGWTPSSRSRRVRDADLVPPRTASSGARAPRFLGVCGFPGRGWDGVACPQARAGLGCLQRTFAARSHRPGRPSFARGAATLGHRGEVAQLVEHTAENRGVAGSIPALATFA